MIGTNLHTSELELNILVTGGLGFIGSHFIRLALNELQRSCIFNVDNMSFGSNPENLSDCDKAERYTFIKSDVNDIFEIKQLRNENIDVIVNFAAETHVDRSIADPTPFLHSNYLGTFKLLEFARRKNISKFIQVSTDEVYGEAPYGCTFKETDPLNPSNPYSASKAAADLLVRSYFRTYGLKIAITRCTNNFGPNQFPEKLIPKTIARILLGKSVVLYGNGQQSRDWLYVKDHVKAISAVILKGSPGEIYNISGTNSMTNFDIVSKIKTILKQEVGKETQIEFGDDRPGHDARYSIDSCKIRKELGWEASKDFDAILTETVRWYLNNRNWWEKLINSSTLHTKPWQLNFGNKT